MQIHEIHDLSNTVVIDLLKREFAKITDNTIIKNYHPDYENTPGNFFDILAKGRYEKGCYYIIEDGDYVGSAGWNEYNADTALLMTRMYVSPKYRVQYYLGNNLLPLMIKNTSTYNKQWMTVNSYNVGLYKWFERSVEGKATSLFNNWPDIYKQFKPVGMHTVYYTEQYVVEYIK
jgi:hypothetical protein